MTWKDARLNKHLTLKEVANELRITIQAISMKENGHRRIYAREAKTLCRLYGVKLSDIDM